MKLFTTLLSATVLLTACLLQSAYAEPPTSTAPVYDFDWHPGGDAAVRPYQVFDDGQRIYLQFDDPKRVPAIFADTPAGLVLLHWRPDPPYVVVDRLDPALLFRTAGREARAVRMTPGRPPRMARFGSPLPSTETAVTAPDRIESTPPRNVSPPSQSR